MLIHQIWIGDRPAPERWMRTVREFCDHHGHEYVFWGNAEARDIAWHRYPGAADLFAEYERRETRQRYSGQADILRLAILYEQGGLYVDADMVVVNPAGFHELLVRMEGRVFAGWESTGSLVANSVIGAPRGHAFLGACLDHLPVFARETATRPTWYRSGPFFLTEMLNRAGDVYRDDIVILPQSFFYADGWHRVRDPRLHERRTFGPETLLFQYGYTTNDLGDVLEKGSVGRLAYAAWRPFRRLWRSVSKRLGADRPHSSGAGG